MNRINQLFNSNKKDILSIYFCAGTPTLDGTANVIRTLEKHGVSMIEIGIPFSDPMADGIVIQNASFSLLMADSQKLISRKRELRDIRLFITLMVCSLYSTNLSSLARKLSKRDLISNLPTLSWNSIRNG